MAVRSPWSPPFCVASFLRVCRSSMGVSLVGMMSFQSSVSWLLGVWIHSGHVVPGGVVPGSVV